LKAGLFRTIDHGEKIAKGGPPLVAEGYDTAASAHMASNMPTIVAFDASNLEPVAKVLKGKYPKSTIVLVRDMTEITTIAAITSRKVKPLCLDGCFI
jgi:phage/plasmid primase-like uncharacterized protein